MSLIKLTIGSDSAGGSKSSNPIIAAESQARAAEAALAESNIDAASLAESEVICALLLFLWRHEAKVKCVKWFMVGWRWPCQICRAEESVI